MILATQNGFETFDFDTQTRTTLVDPESDLKNNRFNDGKCDVRGRFWAGTMSMVREAKAGSLYVLETDHRVRTVIWQCDDVQRAGLEPRPIDHVLY